MTDATNANTARRATDVIAAPARRPMRMRLVNVLAVAVAALIAILAFVFVERVAVTEAAAEANHDLYAQCYSAARDLREASDYLTSQSRMYVITGTPRHMNNYLNELLVARRRDNAVAVLRENLQEEQAVRDLEIALRRSNELAERELLAMRIVADATGLEDMPELIAQVEVPPEIAAMPVAERRSYAESLLFDEDYRTTKEQINAAVSSCSKNLVAYLDAQRAANEAELRQSLVLMRIFVGLLVTVVVLVIVTAVVLILRPLDSYTRQIMDEKPLELSGASELQYLAAAYNLIYEENRQRTLSLQHAAERDGLTGLYNRGAYDALLQEHTQDVALLLIDVDHFKEVNDEYGHSVGDDVLRRVASTIEHNFRSTDYPCRVGGDEFAVIMTDITPALKHVVEAKIRSIADNLREAPEGLPPTTLSIGVAFSGTLSGEDDIYKAADEALYVVKERGRNGFAFYGEE